MDKQYFLPKDNEARRTWLGNFSAKLPTYADKYGISSQEASQTQADYELLGQLFSYHTQFQEFTRSITQYKNSLMNETAPLQPLVVPTPPLAQAGVVPGIFVRARSLAARIKAHLEYTEADGRDLGIIGAEGILPDASTHKPVLKLRIVGGGYPEVLWKKGAMGAIEIESREAGGSWQFLAIDTVPDYIDTTPLPPAGQAVVREYRAIYLLDDARYGAWSDVVSISVRG